MSSITPTLSSIRCAFSTRCCRPSYYSYARSRQRKNTRIIHLTRSLSSHGNPKRPNRHHHGNVKEGLVLSEERIERIWKSFNVDSGVGNDKFNREEFFKEFPHVIKQLLDTDQGTSRISPPRGTMNEISSQRSIETPKPPHSTTRNNMNNKLNEKHFQVVEDEEEKLKRMFSKVKAQGNIPSSTKNEIQTLLMKELETVLELWLSVANTFADKIHDNDNENNEEVAILALDRAKTLLLKFEAEYVLELRKALEYDDESDLILTAPHTINYQKIISAYYYIYTKKERSISQTSLVEMQSKCSSLLKKMIKHIISRRMQALEYAEETEEIQSNNDQIIEQRGHFGLNTSPKQLISMYTSRIHMTSYTDAIEMVTLASNLLQEMELYYHDFFTVPSVSKNNQKFLLTISPTRGDFNNVIHAYSRIAIKFHCSASAQKALEVVNRMIKRCEAYTRESDGLDKTMNAIVAPNLSSFKAVVGAFASQNELSMDDLETIEKLMNTMDKYENVQSDRSMDELVKQCSLKCVDDNKEKRFKRINESISSIKNEGENEGMQ